MWNDSRTLNLMANALYLAAAMALGCASLVWVAQRPMFELHGIWIEADEGALAHVTPATVRSAIAGRITGNFFTADLERVREVFETVPWVRQASVRRQWPNSLVVTLQEHRVLGLWNENRLLNTYGESFTANLGEAEEDGSLPVFSGPQGSEKIVAQRYADMLRWFGPLHSAPVRVALSQRYAWQIVLSSGLTMDLGRDPATVSTVDTTSLESRVQRFVQAMPVLDQRVGRTTHADLRYPNGFAIVTAKPDKPARKHSTVKPTQKKP